MEIKNHAERTAYGPQEIAARNGVGIATIWRAIAAGTLNARKLGRRTLITAPDEQTWLNSLPSARSSNAAA